MAALDAFACDCSYGAPSTPLDQALDSSVTVHFVPETPRPVLRFLESNAMGVSSGTPRKQ